MFEIGKVGHHHLLLLGYVPGARPAKSIRLGNHLHRVAIENGPGMACANPFDRHAAFIKKRGKHMGMRDRVARLCLWTEPAHAIHVPDPLSTHGKRVPAIRHRQRLTEPTQLVADRLRNRARPQGMAHGISGVEKARPHTGARYRTGRNETKIHDNHAAQVDTDQLGERQSLKVSDGIY